MQKKTHPNLWDVHPPFQIDGNFGAIAGMAEMLLQSHEGFISILPALPKCWKNVHVKGLKARGNFDVDIVYKNGLLEEVKVTSIKGSDLALYYPGINKNTCVKDNSKEIPFQNKDCFISLKTEAGHTYVFTDFAKVANKEIIEGFNAAYQDEGVLLTWISKNKVALYRSKENQPTYDLLGLFEGKSSYLDKDFSNKNKGRATYKLIDASISYSPSEKGAITFIHPASKLEEDRYKLRLRTNNLIGEKIGWDFD